jgi:hypothetical protein
MRGLPVLENTSLTGGRGCGKVSGLWKQSDPPDVRIGRAGCRRGQKSTAANERYLSARGYLDKLAHAQVRMNPVSGGVCRRRSERRVVVPGWCESEGWHDRGRAIVCFAFQAHVSVKRRCRGLRHTGAFARVLRPHTRGASATVDLAGCELQSAQTG